MRSSSLTLSGFLWGEGVFFEAVPDFKNDLVDGDDDAPDGSTGGGVRRAEWAQAVERQALHALRWEKEKSQKTLSCA